ncbi:hypothetical protein ChPV098 [Cheloniid poxvirus 1]|nr:hypothetical protein ChPV098 [Cheloniid poxvirus 1]
MMEWPSIVSMISVPNAIISSTLVLVMVNTNVVISGIFTLTIIIINPNTAYTVLYIYILSYVCDVNTTITLFIGISLINYIVNYIIEFRNQSKVTKRRSLIILDLN